jgi:hypothetical protein
MSIAAGNRDQAAGNGQCFTTTRQDVCNWVQIGRSAVEAGTGGFDPTRKPRCRCFIAGVGEDGDLEQSAVGAGFAGADLRTISLRLLGPIRAYEPAACGSRIII